MTGSENPVFSWHKDDCQVENSLGTPSILTITEPKLNDAGRYECQVTDTDFGTQIKRAFEIQIPSKPIAPDLNVKNSLFYIIGRNSREQTLLPWVG